MSDDLRQHWALDPDIDFLNHGSFGACPREVLALQQRLRDELERDPVAFFMRSLEGRLDAARVRLAEFVGADPDGMAFVANATTGVNTVLKSIPFNTGDELVVTDQEYNACRNALDLVARNAGARVVVASVPFPLASSGQVVDAIVGRFSKRTRLLLVDHISSPTGLVLPVAELAEACRQRGVELLVDGAHAVGQLELNLGVLRPTYYTSNCHKWLCTPKGAAFLYVDADHRDGIRPLVTSHGASADASRRPRFRLEFDWVGTNDPTPFLCVPEAIRCVGSLLDGGWPAVRDHNRALALEARSLLCEALEVAPPCPEEMVGSLAAVPLPPANVRAHATPLQSDPLAEELFAKHRIEVPVVRWPASPERLVRISAQLYNRRDQYERLAAALKEILATEA